MAANFPVYVYICSYCQHDTEFREDPLDDTNTRCSNCNRKGTLTFVRTKR